MNILGLISQLIGIKTLRLTQRTLEGKKNKTGSSRTNDIENYPFTTPFPQLLIKNLDVIIEILEHL